MKSGKIYRSQHLCSPHLVIETQSPFIKLELEIRDQREVATHISRFALFSQRLLLQDCRKEMRIIDDLKLTRKTACAPLFKDITIINCDDFCESKIV